MEAQVRVDCIVCGAQDQQVLLPAATVRAHLRYLREFHRRRLRPRQDGSVPAEELADRADFTQDYVTNIVRCRQCGLVFRNPRPTKEAIARAYAQDHYGDPRMAALFEAQVELYRPKARRLRELLPAAAHVVEVGSFVGGFLQAAREQGFTVLGVDPGAEVDSFCSERGLPVFQGTLADAPVAAGSLDCVAIWNTFDQLPDPGPTLQAAQRLLRPGGVLAVRVPSGESFRRLERLLGHLPPSVAGWVRAAMAWNNLLAFPYLHGYSPETLDRLLWRHGLDRLAIEPDTLPRLSDEQTRTWAALEESALKGVLHAAAWLARAGRPAQLAAQAAALLPWFDAYYQYRPRDAV